MNCQNFFLICFSLQNIVNFPAQIFCKSKIIIISSWYLQKQGKIADLSNIWRWLFINWIVTLIWFFFHIQIFFFLWTSGWGNNIPPISDWIVWNISIYIFTLSYIKSVSFEEASYQKEISENDLTWALCTLLFWSLMIGIVWDQNFIFPRGLQQSPPEGDKFPISFFC